MGKFSHLFDWIRSRKKPIEQDWELQSLAIDTTSICNLKCVTCSLEDWYPQKGVMSLDTFKALRRDLPKLKSIALANSAEPLLNKNLFEMVRMAKEVSNCRLPVSFTTNGMLLNDKAVQSVLDLDLDAIEFSLDGATKETFERIRIGANYDLIIKNIKTLVKRKQELNREKPHISIRFVLYQDNVHELCQMVHLTHQLGVNHLVVNGLEPYTAAMAEKILYTQDKQSDTAGLFEKTSSLGKKYGMRLDLPALIPDSVVDCLMVVNNCIIRWDGEVAPCSSVAYKRPFYHYQEKKEHPSITFGNINDRSLWDIWRSKEYVNFRNDLRNGRIYDFCRICLHREGLLCPLDHWKWLSSN